MTAPTTIPVRRFSRSLRSHRLLVVAPRTDQARPACLRPHQQSLRARWLAACGYMAVGAVLAFTLVDLLGGPR